MGKTKYDYEYKTYLHTNFIETVAPFTELCNNLFICEIAL